MTALAVAIRAAPTADEGGDKNPTVVDIGDVSDERREALAGVLARILVAQALAELGVTPANDNGPPR